MLPALSLAPPTALAIKGAAVAGAVGVANLIRTRPKTGLNAASLVTGVAGAMVPLHFKIPLMGAAALLGSLGICVANDEDYKIIQERRARKRERKVMCERVAQGKKIKPDSLQDHIQEKFSDFRAVFSPAKKEYKNEVKKAVEKADAFLKKGKVESSTKPKDLLACINLLKPNRKSNRSLPRKENDARGQAYFNLMIKSNICEEYLEKIDFTRENVGVCEKILETLKNEKTKLAGWERLKDNLPYNYDKKLDNIAKIIESFKKRAS